MRKFSALLLVLFSCFCATAVENLSLLTHTDIAFYPESKPVAGGNHLAPVTGPYDGVELRITGIASYKIPVPMGTSPLTKGNNVAFNGSLELSPVSFLFGAEVSFTPVAFLKFSAGAQLGSAWNFLSFQGLGKLDIDFGNNPPAEYKNLNALSRMYQYYYLQGLFQFDLAAVVPGEWNHVVAMASARYYWHGMTGMGKGDVWNFKTVVDNANGFKYDNTILVGYQMPLVLQTVALQVEFEGYLNGEDAFGSSYKDWNPDFMTVDFAPTFIFKFTEKDMLLGQLSFKSRRSYVEVPENTDNNVLMKCDGREWYFRRIAFRYTHYF